MRITKNSILIIPGETIMRETIRIFALLLFVIFATSQNSFLYSEEVEEETEGDAKPVFNLTVKKFKFKGNTKISHEELYRITDKFFKTTGAEDTTKEGTSKGRKFSLDGLKLVTQHITEAYVNKGYALARAYLPVQTIEKGEVEIEIIEGRIDNFLIQISGTEDENDALSKYYKMLISKYFEPQLSHEVYNSKLIKRGLLLARDLPFVSSEDSKLLIKKGDKDSLDLLFKTKYKSPISMSFDANNYGSEMVSKERFGLSWSAGLPIGGWEAALRGVMGSNEKIHMGTANLKMPIGNNGHKIDFTLIRGSYIVGESLAELGMKGNTSIHGVKYSHQCFYQEKFKMNITVGFDRKRTDSSLYEKTRSIDELDLYGVKAQLEFRDTRFLKHNALNILTGGFEIGSVNEKNKLLPSRLEYSKNFQKFIVSLTRFQEIDVKGSKPSSLLLMFSGQFSKNRLLPIEQSVLGGYGMVRGHKPASMMGDSGYFVSAELNLMPSVITDKKPFKLNQSWGQLAQMVLFFDHGGIMNSSPMEGEYSSRHLSGYGFGFRYSPKNAFTLKFDLAFPVDRKKDEDNVYTYLFFNWNIPISSIMH